jgi:hypothetical protein
MDDNTKEHIMAAIVVRDIETNEEIHRIELRDGSTDREIEKAERGLARNFDFDRFVYGVEQ